MKQLAAIVCLSMIPLAMASSLDAAAYPREGELEKPLPRVNLKSASVSEPDTVPECVADAEPGLPRDAVTLVRYLLGTEDYDGAEKLALSLRTSAGNPTQVAEADALLEDVSRQRELTLRIALDSAERARQRSDWTTLRRETARALAADPENAQALALARWMESRGIIRPWLVAK